MNTPMKTCQFCTNVLRTCSESRSGVCEDCQIMASTSRALFQGRTNWAASVKMPKDLSEKKGAKAS